jgi:anti-sigma B factor antagonist
MEAGSDFSVTRRRIGDACVVVPVGEIDLATVDDVRAELAAAVHEEASVLYLDLREVTFIDSAGIRAIVEFARVSDLVIVRGPLAVRRLFDLVGLEGRVRMVDEPPAE